MGVLRLGDRRRTRLFLRRDLYGRFFSCLVYLPRENFNTDVRVKIQEILKRRLAGTQRGVHRAAHRRGARAHPHPGAHAPAGRAARRRLAPSRPRSRRPRAAGRTTCKLALTEAHGEERAIPLLRRYAPAFPVAYRDTLPARAAVRDIAVIETLDAANPFAVSLYRPVEADARTLRLRVYRLGARLPLSASLPILENMGLEAMDEDGWEIEREDSPAVFLHDFGLRSARELADVRGHQGGHGGGAAARRARRDRERRLQPPHAGGRARARRRGGAARLRQVPASRPASRSARPTSRRRWPRTRPSSRSSWRSSTRASTRRRGAGARGDAAAPARRGEGGAQRRGEPRRGPDPAPLPVHDPRDAAHQPLGARGGRPAQALPRRSSSSRAKVPDLPEPQAALRDLRLLAALRGHPPARRQGRARRPALVRPPRGLPHRDPGPHEGADGEERGDRARWARRGASC